MLMLFCKPLKVSVLYKFSLCGDAAINEHFILHTADCINIIYIAFGEIHVVLLSLKISWYHFHFASTSSFVSTTSIFLT